MNCAPPDVTPFASSCRRYSLGSTGSSLMLAESADEPTELFSSLEVLPRARVHGLRHVGKRALVAIATVRVLRQAGLLELKGLGGRRLHQRIRHRPVRAADRHHLGEDAQRFRIAELIVDQVLRNVQQNAERNLFLCLVRS
uniref:Uncharacterized protein n=1 Tax=Anopheles farauti TaxID=69004 RepID=A0A182QK66_9DIPT